VPADDLQDEKPRFEVQDALPHSPKYADFVTFHIDLHDVQALEAVRVGPVVESNNRDLTDG
jgi:hypothetical protein